MRALSGIAIVRCSLITIGCEKPPDVPNRPTRVDPPVVTTIQVQSNCAALVDGEKSPLEARAVGAKFERLTADVSGTTSSPAVATVSSSGVVTAIDQGTAVITATAAGASGTATVSETRTCRRVGRRVHAHGGVTAGAAGVTVSASVRDARARMLPASRDLG